MNRFPEELKRKINQRKEDNSFRNLMQLSSGVDFVSNDYLGFSKKEVIQEKALELLGKNHFKNGSTGARLLSGNHPLHELVETQLANFHKTEAALLFNSGYDANIGLFSAILQKGATIFYDELIHASIRDGIRLSHAKAFKFKHNSLEDLRKKRNKASGTVFIAVESVYSMDGDSAPLKELVDFSIENNCFLIVDEAHSNGVFGENGSGMLQDLHQEDKVFARVHTFGKALGCHGAVVLGSKELKEYLVNFSRSFMYTTAASLHSVALISAAYQELYISEESAALKKNILFFKEKIVENKLQHLFVESDSAIQCCLISGNKKVKDIAGALQKKGYQLKPILSPTVPKGKERLRFCLHSYNIKEEIAEVLRLLATFV
jgi:8-amino-7-oxononanoate synthase